MLPRAQPITSEYALKPILIGFLGFEIVVRGDMAVAVHRHKVIQVVDQDSNVNVAGSQPDKREDWTCEQTIVQAIESNASLIQPPKIA